MKANDVEKTLVFEKGEGAVVVHVSSTGIEILEYLTGDIDEDPTSAELTFPEFMKEGA